MKLALCLLVLIPLVYCTTLEEEISEIERRFLFKAPSMASLKSHICSVLNHDLTHKTCELACPIALKSFPGGTHFKALCKPACAAIHC